MFRLFSQTFLAIQNLNYQILKFSGGRSNHVGGHRLRRFGLWQWDPQLVHQGVLLWGVDRLHSREKSRTENFCTGKTLITILHKKLNRLIKTCKQKRSATFFVKPSPTQKQKVEAACKNSAKQLPLCSELLEQDELFGDEQALGTCRKEEQETGR